METQLPTGSGDTRQKILETASRLFSSYGYEGTSIRSIAKACQVNIAAVNYHFTNKEKLFWEVIEAAVSAAEDSCRIAAEKAGTLEEYACGLLAWMLDDAEMVRNTMRLLLNDALQSQHVDPAAPLNPDRMGPPGARYISAFVRQEIDYPLSEAAEFWAAKVIFNFIVHMTMIRSTSTFQSQCRHQPLMGVDQVTMDLKWLVRSTLAYLKTQPELFRR